MAPSDPEVIVDRVGNLSAAKETVLFLGFSFLQTDSPSELGIMDDFVQGWSNPRIKYSKIRHWNTTSRWRRSSFIHWINQLHFFDPLHRFRQKLWTSTYLGLEPYLPASEGCWCRELVKMEIRNLQSLLGLPHNSLKSLLHWRWLNLWLTVQTGISDLDFVLVFSLFSAVDMWSGSSMVVSHGFNYWACGFAKNVSRYTMCIANAWRPFFAARRYEWMPQHPFRYRMYREWHWLVGNVGISTAHRLSILKILRIVHTIYFVLQFLYSAW